MAAGNMPPPPTVPVGVAVFPHDLFVPIRRFADRDLPTISHWTEFDRGGHFAAMEQPELLVDDIQAFFRSLK
jgi:pimeloyl-ACP methyl ester carboxylesterase